MFRIKYQTVLKILLVGAIMSMVAYTFRSQAGPIFQQLQKTNAMVVLEISICGLLYNLVEGWVLCSMMRLAKPDFHLCEGVYCSCYSSFYRVATMGSGSGVAAVLYLNKKGIEYSKATGYYMIHYMLHKLATVFMACAGFLLNYDLMKREHKNYFRLALSGSVIAVVICAVLVMACCWSAFHACLIKILQKLDRRKKHSERIRQYEEFFRIMETSGAEVLKNRNLVIGILFRNLLKCFCWYIIPYLILRESYFDGIVVYTGLTAISVVLASVIPSPAGIGSTEVVFMMLFAALTTESVAGSTALLYRFATFFVPFVFGGLLAGIVRLKNGKNKIQGGKHER